MSTIAFVHAHPDDETLLTGGTMALLAAKGHRVVLVTATMGEAGLTASGSKPAERLGHRRSAELRNAATILGCARVELLGYPDSGFGPRPLPGSFSTVAVDTAAARLADILREERADVVTGYDHAGGYGHPDHLHLHHVTRAAATMAGTAFLLEATVDRRPLQRALRLARPFTRNAPDFRAARFDNRYSGHTDITHRIDVRDFSEHKRAAMRAHASQTDADHGTRSLARFLSLPTPLFRAVFGTEWYIGVGLPRTRRPARVFPAA